MRPGARPPLAHLFAALVALAPQPGAAADASPPVVAVFNLENDGTALTSRELERLTDYLAARLAEDRRFRVVPKAALRTVLREKQLESYEACYDESCQIEIGKELAAQETLQSKVQRFGGICVLTLTLYDLRSSATHGAATAEGGCAEEEVFAAAKQAVTQLIRSTQGPTTEVPELEAPDPEPLALEAPAHEEPPPEPQVQEATSELAPPDTSGLTIGVELGSVVDGDGNFGWSAAGALGYRVDLGPLSITPEAKLSIDAISSLGLWLDTRSVRTMAGARATLEGEIKLFAALYAGVASSTGAWGFDPELSIRDRTRTDFTWSASGGLEIPFSPTLDLGLAGTLSGLGFEDTWVGLAALARLRL